MTCLIVPSLPHVSMPWSTMRTGALLREQALLERVEPLEPALEGRCGRSLLVAEGVVRIQREADPGTGLDAQPIRRARPRPCHPAASARLARIPPRIALVSRCLSHDQASSIRIEVIEMVGGGDGQIGHDVQCSAYPCPIAAVPAPVPLTYPGSALTDGAIACGRGRRPIWT